MVLGTGVTADMEHVLHDESMECAVRGRRSKVSKQLVTAREAPVIPDGDVGTGAGRKPTQAVNGPQGKRNIGIGPQRRAQ